MSTLFLRPRATQPEVLASRRLLPLGSIIVVPAVGDVLADLGVALECRRMNPWCPGVVLLDENPVEERRSLVRSLGMVAATVVRDSGGLGSIPSARELRKFIATQPIPTHKVFACYVGLRCSAPLAHLVETTLCAHEIPVQLRRPLRKHGKFSPRGWRSLYLSLRLLAQAVRGALSEAQVALNNDVAPKTASQWCARFYGCSWPSLISLGAWEAMLELALRNSGYV